MAIKKPTINKPGIVKPTINKKAPSAPVKVVKEEPAVEQVVEQVIGDAIEETIEENEIEVPMDMIVEEPASVEVVKEPEQEIVAVEEVVEEVVEEAAEEVIEEIPEDVVVEPEPVKEQPKKKSSRKKSTKKVEEKVEEQAPISSESYQAKPLIDAMKEMIGITGCTTPEWEATKAEIVEQVQGMQISHFCRSAIWIYLHSLYLFHYFCFSSLPFWSSATSYSYHFFHCIY